VPLLATQCRTRWYVDSGLCFLELKLKGRRGETSKRKMEYNIGDHGRITVVGYEFLRKELTEAYGAQRC
jgi:hypothetical protein